jgi:hypothetical protein
MTPFADAAQHLAVDLGWRVLPVKPHGKEPLTAHGVKDATNVEREVLHLWDRYPDANVGVATGSPGPSVLDVDDPQAAAFVLAGLENAETPESATARGRHLFYAGSPTGTVSLGYGELRGRGSYVVVPPSIHPNGKEYVWLNEPRSRALPPIPTSLVGEATPAGVGVMSEREGKIGHGERHDYLKDVATRLVRSGIVDVRTLERLIRGEYELNCEQQPPARADEFLSLAEWAAGTRIASRERNRAEHREGRETGPEQALALPSWEADTAEHRAFVHKLAGLPANVEIREVRRYGNRPSDALEIWLSTGVVVEFARADEPTRHGNWQRVLALATNGDAKPPAGLKEPQLLALLSSLARLSVTSRYTTEAEAHADTLREFLARCEPVLGYTLAGSPERFRLIEALRGRERFDPFDRSSLAGPALVTDERDGARYVRGGELADFFRYKGAGLNAREFPGRMAMAGLAHVAVNGREPTPLDPSRGRRSIHTVLYRLGETP